MPPIIDPNLDPNLQQNLQQPTQLPNSASLGGIGTPTSRASGSQTPASGSQTPASVPQTPVQNPNAAPFVAAGVAAATYPGLNPQRAFAEGSVQGAYVSGASTPVMVPVASPSQFHLHLENRLLQERNDNLREQLAYAHVAAQTMQTRDPYLYDDLAGHYPFNPYQMGSAFARQRRAQLARDREYAEIARLEQLRFQMQGGGLGIGAPMGLAAVPPGGVAATQPVIVNSYGGRSLATSDQATTQTATQAAEQDERAIQATEQGQRATQAEISTTTPSSNGKPGWLLPTALVSFGTTALIGITAFLAHTFNWGRSYEERSTVHHSPTISGWKTVRHTKVKGRKPESQD